jgi:hypothetical protein
VYEILENRFWWSSFYYLLNINRDKLQLIILKELFTEKQDYFSNKKRNQKQTIQI